MFGLLSRPLRKTGSKFDPNKALAISGKLTSSSNSPEFRLAKYEPQQATIAGDGIEVIFMSFVSLYNEWQGSTVTTFYNSDGTVDEQYVADVVITRSEYEPTDWTCRFEVKFEDGVGYLHHEPGMFTGFHLGTPIQDHEATVGWKPPLDLLPSQFTSPELRELYYQTFPEQINYDRRANPNAQPPGGHPRTTSFLVAPQRDPDLPPRPPQNGCCNTVVGWRPMAHDAGIGCGAAAGGCGIASAFFAEAPFAPCFVAGCAGSILYAAAGHLRLRRR